MKSPQDIWGQLPWLKPEFFLLFWLLLWLPIAWGVGKRLHWRLGQPVSPDQKLPLVLSLYAIAPLVIALTMDWDQQSLSSYGLRLTLKDGGVLLGGVAIALGGLSLIFWQQVQQGLMAWHVDKFKEALKLSPVFLLLATVIAGFEELIFRGIFQQQLGEIFPYWSAAVIISIGFALLHLLWERQLTRWQLPGLWLLGMVMALACWLQRGNLALAIGLHGGWVLGLALSDSVKLITYPDDEGNWWVGIGNQPLAGAAGILCISLTGFGLWGGAVLLAG